MGGRVGSCRWQFLGAGVRAKSFLCVIYCSNLRPKPKYQPIYRFHRVMGRKYLRIMWQYNLANAIEIRLLTQPCTCEMSPSSFSAMSRLKFVSTTRFSFPSMPSTERTNTEKFSVDHGSVYCAYLSFAYPNETGASTHVRAFRFPHPSIQIWSQWCCQSGLPISPGCELHLVFPALPCHVRIKFTDLYFFLMVSITDENMM